MKLVTTTDALSKEFGLKGAIKHIKEAGFDAYDCSLFESMKPGEPLALTAKFDYAREVRRFADSLGILCTQTHAPFPPLRSADDIKAVIESHIEAIEVSAILGAQVIVIHPSSAVSMQENFDLLYTPLLPYAKKHNIKIATENMFKWNASKTETVPAACGTVEEFCEYVDYPKSEYFTACLDIGHTELPNTEGAVAFIRGMGKERISALHIHDNDKISDKHVFPMTGSINWDEVCRALAEIDYGGNFTFEADSTLYNYPPELLPTALALLHKIGRHLIGKIESYKKIAN